MSASRFHIIIVLILELVTNCKCKRIICSTYKILRNITKTKVETLRLVDTAWLGDTVTDSVYVQVEVPIFTYEYDTLFQSDSVKTHLRAVLEGFDVSVDTLSIDWEIVHQKAKNLPKKWYQHIAPAVGAGYGTGGWGVFVGVGYTL